MVRNLVGQHSSRIGLDEYHTGCMGNILHILDYHHWHHHSKKSSPFRRKHGRGKHATICCRDPKTYSFQHYNPGMEDYLDAEAVPLQDDVQISKTSKTKGIADKTDTSEVVSKQSSEKSWQQQTDSMGHFVPSGHFLGRVDTDWTNPIIILHKSSDIAGSRLQASSVPKNYGQIIGAKNRGRGISCPQLKDCADAFQICKMHKNSFVDFLNNPVVNSQRNSEIQKSNKRMRLRKSGSFPSAESPYLRYAWPATLEDKQKETWSFPRGSRHHTEDQELKSAASKSPEGSLDDKGGSATDQETTRSSSHGLHKHGWHLSFSIHFRGLKKKMKHVLKESKKETHGAATNSLLQRVPSSGYRLSSGEEQERSKSFDQTNGSDNDLSTEMRRTSSLHDSVGRYSQLFDFTLSREEKWQLYQSKSLRLSNEEKLAPNGHSLKSFGRRLSLSDLDSLFPLANDAPRDSFSSKIPTKAVRDCKTKVGTDSCNSLTSLSIPVDGKQVEQMETIEETEHQENSVETAQSLNRNRSNKKNSEVFLAESDGEHTKIFELHQDIPEPGNEEESPHLDEVTCSTMNSSIQCEDQSTISVLDTSFQDHVNGPAELPVSEGLELNPDQKTCIHEADSIVDIKDGTCKVSVAAVCSSQNPQSANITFTVDNHFHGFESNRLGDAYFNYAKDVLEVSGFTEQNNLEKWYSLDQPLNPALFKELEMCLHQVGTEFSSCHDIGYNCDHHLLFNMINEKLLEIYKSSLAYFPETFSFTQLERRAPPKGNRIVEEVWNRIEKQRSWRSEMESLDDIVARDMGRKDAWMDVEIDAEDVALELEDLIFSELLDEVML